MEADMRSDVSNDQKAITVDDATLPVINLGGLFTGDPADKARVAAELGRAARMSGFFYITGHGVPQDLIDGVMAASREFHGKPRSYKMRWWSGFTTHHRGYVRTSPNQST
jgi:isopenicillin N synthase-like dioxygenase